MMTTGTRYTFEEITTLANDEELFSHILSEREGNGDLSRKAKSSFAKLLGRYDQRQATTDGIFRLEGKGKTRRYLIIGHGGHGGHGVSPLLRKHTFSISA